MNALDTTCKYITRAGHIVTLHETVLKNSCGDLVTFPLKGSVKNPNRPRSQSRYQIWTLDGRANVLGQHPDDLMTNQMVEDILTQRNKTIHNVCFNPEINKEIKG
jgi:hypothetical protein